MMMRLMNTLTWCVALFYAREGVFWRSGEINWERELQVVRRGASANVSLAVKVVRIYPRVRRNVHFSPRTSWCQGARWEQFLLLIRAATEDQANKANSFSPSAANRTANRGNKCTGAFFKCLCSEVKFIAGATQSLYVTDSSFWKMRFVYFC